MNKILLAAFTAAVALSACGGGGPDAGSCPFPGNCPGATSGPAPGGGTSTSVLQRGTGAFVLKLPSSVDVVRIQGTTPNGSENFADRADGRLIVNEVIGTRSTPASHDGTYSVTAGATIEIVQADGVNWTVSAASSTPAPPGGVFARQGTGASVFELPQRTARYLVRASYAGTAENFAVLVADRLQINALIGTSSSPATFDGTYLFAGGRVEVLTGPGVTWSFAEQP